MEHRVEPGAIEINVVAPLVESRAQETAGKLGHLVQDITDETPTVAPTRRAWEQILLQDLTRLVNSFDDETNEFLTTIIKLLKASGKSTVEIGKLMDDWIRTLYTASSKENTEGGIESDSCQKKSSGRKIDCH